MIFLNPSETLELSDLEETNLSEWDKLNQINEKIETDPQPDSSGLEIFELDEFVSDPVSDIEEDTAQLQTFNIDDLENEENEAIDLAKEDSDDCELKEIYEEDGVCIMISEEGQDTDELNLEKQIEEDDLKNRKAEILNQKEKEKELLKQLKEPPKVLPSKEWDVINYAVEQNPDMKFQENVFEDIMIVTINLERCTLQYASEFRSYMLSLMSSNTKKIIVDMTYSNFMDSSFLGALVASLKKLKTLNGDLRLVWDDPNHTTMLFLTGMDKIFKIYDNIKEAIFKFSDDV